MVSALDSGSNGPGSRPDGGHCVVFFDKTLSAYLHPGVEMGTSELMLGGNAAMDQHPIQGGVEIPLGTKCYRNRDKLRSDGPLGSYADFTFTRPGQCVVVLEWYFSLQCRDGNITITPYPQYLRWITFSCYLRTKAQRSCSFVGIQSGERLKKSFRNGKKVKILLPCVFFCMTILSIFFRMRIASTFKVKRPCTRFFFLCTHTMRPTKQPHDEPRISHLTSIDCHFSLDFHLIRHFIPTRIVDH